MRTHRGRLPCMAPSTIVCTHLCQTSRSVCSHTADTRRDSRTAVTESFRQSNHKLYRFVSSWTPEPAESVNTEAASPSVSAPWSCVCSWHGVGGPAECATWLLAGEGNRFPPAQLPKAPRAHCTDSGVVAALVDVVVREFARPFCPGTGTPCSERGCMAPVRKRRARADRRRVLSLVTHGARKERRNPFRSASCVVCSHFSCVACRSRLPRQPVREQPGPIVHRIRRFFPGMDAGRGSLLAVSSI